MATLSGWTGDGSGHLYNDILLPLFKEFRGNLHALIIWEGGDSIVQLSIEDSIEESEAVNAVYYRLFVGRDDQPRVICMQQFDEDDYDQSRFINEERYGSEEEAKEALLTLKTKAGMPLSALEGLKLADQQR